MLLLAFCLTTCIAFAQTSLSAGDIAFIGVSTDGDQDFNDFFAFVILKDIATNTTITFTDRGWNDGSGFVQPLARGDGEFTWTAESAFSAGEVVILSFENLSPPAAAFTVRGDQLFAIQGTIANPIFVAGLHLNVVDNGSDDANWDGAATTNTTSALPDALTTGDTAIRFPIEQDNWQFSCSIGLCPLTGTLEEIRAILHNPANWISDNDNVFPGTIDVNLGAITVSPVNTPPLVTSLDTANAEENQVGAIDINATDDNDAEGAGLTYNLSGGADQAFFTIDADTGIITFNSSPDFEIPTDASGDNVYEVQVTVTDSGGLNKVQNILITVTNVVELGSIRVLLESTPSDGTDFPFNLTRPGLSDVNVILDDDNTSNPTRTNNIQILSLVVGDYDITTALPVNWEIDLIDVSVGATTNPITNGVRVSLKEEQDVVLTFHVINNSPIIICPTNVTVNVGDSIDPSSIGTATATGGTGVLTVTNSDSWTTESLLTRTWTATDTNGNSSSCVQLITVIITDRNLICPDNQSLYADASGTVALPDFTHLVTVDFGAGATTVSTEPSWVLWSLAFGQEVTSTMILGSLVQSPAPGTSIGLGTTPVTMTSGTYSCSFDVVVSSVDITPPTVVSLSPLNGAIDVAVDANLIITFNESIQGAGGVISIYQDAGLLRVIPLTDSQVTISGNVLTIDPELDLPANANISVGVSAGALEDVEGNGFGGLNAGVDWHFTTVAPIDNIPPMAACQDVTVVLDEFDNATLEISQIDNGSTDNVAIVSYGVQRRVARVFDKNIVPEVIFGSGNANGGFTVNQTGSVELGLRAKVRYPSPQNTFNSNGDGTYLHAAIAGGTSLTRASWNFEWSINTDPTGTLGNKLNGLTYEMGIDYDASTGTDYYIFDPINLPLADHAIGNNMTVNGGGTTAAGPASYVGLLAANNVAQNSWNLDFFNEQAGKAFDPNVDGTYEIYLKAFDGSGANVGETKITIVVGNGGAPGMLPQRIDFTAADIGTNVVELLVVDEAGNVAICTSTVTVEHEVEPCSVAIETQPLDISLCSGNEGEIFIKATGNGILSYQWQLNFQGTGSFSNLNRDLPNWLFTGPGTIANGNQYRVIVTSDNGTPDDDTDDCSVISEVATLTVNPTPLVEIEGNKSYCHDGDGVVLDAGAGYSSYLWFPSGETTQTITALEGSYTVEVTNENGCTMTSETFTVTNNQPLVCSIQQDVLSTNHLTADGVATVNTEGGTDQFTYIWDNGEITQTATALTYGMHSVTVIDSNGCKTTCQIDIAKELYCWTNLVQNVSVRGGKDGAARVHGHGGFKPFTYLWSDGSTDELNTALTVGSHEVIITDAKGATSQCSVTITEPNTGNCNDFTSNIVQVKLTTDHETTDGVATVYPKGGTGHYTYLWDNGETTQTATKITYGIHSVTVTDAAGCVSIAQIDIAKELYCWINLYNHVSVHDAKDGSAMVHGNGGYRPHTYVWDDGSTEQLNNNLGSGTHYVTITDATGATSQCSISITEPNQEVCDGIDNDGDGQIDEGFDMDSDGVADCFDTCDKGDDHVDMDNDGIPDACDDTICIKVDKPMTACYQSAVWDEQTCSWIISGEQPLQPITECNQTAEWNGTTCTWNIIDGQRPEMPMTLCYQTVVWSDQICDWEIYGEKPLEPVTECYETAVWNEATCIWDILDGQPEMPSTLCYQTAVWSDQICDWEINGEKAMEPMIECYQIAEWNEQTCRWDVMGEQPEIPNTACNETAEWNAQTCNWDVYQNNNDCDLGAIDQCETAFARSKDENVRTCFVDIPNVSGNRWGWMNEFPATNGTYEMDLYAAAGQCTISNGTLVGNVEVTYANSAVEVMVSTLPGYKITVAQLYVGADILPTDNNGRFTTAPGQYPFSDTIEGDFNTFTFESVNVGNSDKFYVVLHANVCPNGTDSFKSITQLQLTAYPIPFRDHLNLNIESPLNMNGTLSLYNGIGQKLQDFGIYAFKKGDNDINLNTGEIPKGFYFVRMTSVFGTETLKIIRK
ncbi:Por secretion system C-terminal sorting domain-containing protein [Maribacter ulvicola]|uniref:Por secretion system C-terminal sorting domain-containing protein n=2 Tax=Maribacter ulvicola TaxID=228959 RepID=A0A1N6XDI7_9FLAO|nr:Por secretion system C-terminal sorting domain-containing protein [Maribacter ulvicola]